MDMLKAEGNEFYYDDVSDLTVYSRKQLLNGEADYINYDIAIGSLVEDTEIWLLFKYTYVIIFFLAVMCALLMQGSLYAIVAGDSSRTKASSIIAIVLAALLLGVSIAVAALTNLNTPKNYDFVIGKSYIIIMAAATLNLISQAFKLIDKKKAKPETPPAE